MTYRQLDDRTRKLADSLLAGTKGRAPLFPGDRVLLVYPPSLHFVVAFVACLRAGLVAVPVYPPDPRKLRKDIQVRSGMLKLFTLPSFSYFLCEDRGSVGTYTRHSVLYLGAVGGCSKLILGLSMRVTNNVA